MYGRQRIVLSLGGGQGPRISLADAEGIQRMDLRLENDHPLIQFYDENGKQRASFYSAGQEASLMMYDAKGESRLVMGLNERGPAIKMKDERGQARAVWRESLLLMSDTQGRYRTGFYVNDDLPRLDMREIQRNLRIGISLDENGGPAINLTDETGQLRTAIGVTPLKVTNTGETRRTAPSTITLFDKDGKGLWQAP